LDPSSSQQSAARALEPALVLVVDDVDDNREMYAAFLAMAGYRVATACDGEEAVAKASELAPALIVMDVGMPRLDGCEATLRLKRDPATSPIPVIVVTGHVLGEHGARALRAGADLVLGKPLLPEDLGGAIHRLLTSDDLMASGRRQRRT
jgi:CheY-like chemotaxis protein